MGRKLGLALLGVGMAFAALTAFGMGTALSPRALQAQGCGSFSGPMCASNCPRNR